MSSSIFSEKLVTPNDKMLSVELGETKVYYDEICRFINDEYGDFRPEWKYYNPKSGWILKLFHKKRNVLFITPCKNFFRTAFVFGDRAVDAVLISNLPNHLKQELASATKYAEGRGIRIEVRSKEDLNNILDLIKIKLT